MGFPGGSDSRESVCKAGDHLGWEDPLEKEMATCSQYSHLENSTDREPWQATVCGIRKSQT